MHALQRLKGVGESGVGWGERRGAFPLSIPSIQRSARALLRAHGRRSDWSPEPRPPRIKTVKMLCGLYVPARHLQPGRIGSTSASGQSHSLSIGQHADVIPVDLCVAE